jgi:arabinose-5-phosphate isomerase
MNTNTAPAAEDSEAEAALISARRVLALEIKGLNALDRQLDGAFTAAVEAMAATAGRIVVTGMGKSGHIARKIASTLSSTGSPALYIHPGEAGHGDLGMIAQNDVVLALSNSGETPELSAIISFTRRHELPLIGILSKHDSALGEAADIVLTLPAVAEACPMGLAPTTSSTMMLVLGDALAVALLERRGFSPDDFHVLHPDGKLGQGLTRVSEIMHMGESIPLVPPRMEMADVIVAMTAKSFGCVGIVDQDTGALMGIITDGDLRRHMAMNLLEQTAENVMTSNPRSIRPQALAAEAVRSMNAHAQPVTSLFVVDEDQVVGIVHIHDCLRAGVA